MLPGSLGNITHDMEQRFMTGIVGGWLTYARTDSTLDGFYQAPLTLPNPDVELETNLRSGHHPQHPDLAKSRESEVD